MHMLELLKKQIRFLRHRKSQAARSEDLCAKYDAVVSATELNEKQVFFVSYKGRGYSCSPRAIYECMVSDGAFDDYTFIWGLRASAHKELLRYHDECRMLDRAVIVHNRTDDLYRAYASSKYIVVNSVLPDEFSVRPGQIVVQCWHGTPLKKLVYDAVGCDENVSGGRKDTYDKNDRNVKKYTYLLAQSDYCAEKFRTAFHLDENNPELIVLNEGYPRNDALVSGTTPDRSSLLEKYGIKSGETRKIVLYAPTWRGNDSCGYIPDFERLYERLNDKCIFLIRMHSLAQCDKIKSLKSDFVKDVSWEPDINDLFSIADMMVTDYSSSIFDYSLLQRPIILYTPDLKQYRDQQRGLYMDIDELPFEKCADEDGLSDILLSNFNTKNTLDYSEFIRKFAPRDDGHASERIVRAIWGEQSNGTGDMRNE